MEPRQRRAGQPQQADGAAAKAQDGPAEPVWLVRAVLYLFLVGFAAFVAVQLLDVIRAF